MNPTYPLQQLFPGGDFEWAFRMRKADSAEFFTPGDESASVIREKQGILDAHEDRHVVVSEQAGALLKQLKLSLQQWGVALDEANDLPSIARRIEPDLLLMDQSSLKLIAGAVCFPSSWRPTDWLNQAIQDIHEVVPQLNPQIGEMIRRFLSELKPGKAFQRANWSFTRSAELNYHPALERQALDDSIQLEEVHLRIEHQLFTAIEGAVLMGIRIQPIPLSSLMEDQTLRRNLAQAIESMPEDVARYKNLHRGRQKLIKMVSVS